MSTIAASNQLGPDVLKALGLDSKRVLDFNINFAANDLVVVSVRYAIPSNTRVTEVLHSYKLQIVPFEQSTAAPEA